jgi:hypothetical protein
MNEEIFKLVTKALLEEDGPLYYSGGKEVKEGDFIIWGMTIMYANLYGKPTTSFSFHDDAQNLSLTPFVLDKNTGFIYQTYKIKKEDE